MKTEETIPAQKKIRVILRFLNELYLIKYLAVPILLIMVICVIVSRYSVWYIGKFIDIHDTLTPGEILSESITHTVLGFSFQMPFTFTILFYFFGIILVTRVLSWSLFEIPGYWSTQVLHQKMVKAVSNVRTTYFDTNPSGRLINRLVGDYFFASIHFIFPIGSLITLSIDIICVGCIILIAHPIPALLIIPLVIFHIWFQIPMATMLNHCRTIKSNLQGTTLHRQTDLIEGRDIFLLYQKEKNLIRRFFNAFDELVNIDLLIARIKGWSIFWIFSMTTLYELILYMTLMILIHNQTIDLALAAVVFTAAFSLAHLFGEFIFDLAFTVEYSAYVQRVFEIVDLPSETDEEAFSKRKEHSLKKNILISGDIEFQNYSMSYRNDSPLIFKSVSLKIPYGKKIGIVGRTGSGKTSLFQSLFRMVCVQEGDIRINGQSIFDIDINTWRSHFGVVPQNPHLFSGTVWSNISGTEISSQLEDRKRIKSLFEQIELNIDLDHPVNENGSNLSLGERQIICIARIIYSDKDYILLDEPTSSVDNHTDLKIQNLFSSYLSDKTILTIAHRIETLQKSDLIIELEDGKLLRQGRPEEILPLLNSEVIS